MNPKMVIPISSAALGLVLGLGLGWRLWRPLPPKLETYAPQVIQKDKSVVLERKPDPQVRSTALVPDGGVVERITRLTVQAEPLSLPQSPGMSAPPCPPVNVELSLIRLPDGTRRMVAKSDNGTILGGVDIPVESGKETKPLSKAVGLVYGPVDKAKGLFFDYDKGPLRVGIEVIQSQTLVGGSSLRSIDTRIKLGIRF